MLNKIETIGGLFGKKADHPLADQRELRKIVDELPRDNAFRALDEIAGWLESLNNSDELAADRRWEAARQLDLAATPHLRRLGREYLHAPRLSRTEERRLWSISHGFWALIAEAYGRCFTVLDEKGKVGDVIRAAFAELCARALHAYGGNLKWLQFRYGPVKADLWQRIGRLVLLAEDRKQFDKSVTLGGGQVTSPAQEFRRLMVFHAASMDSLLPLEIELAERLIAHYLPAFDFSNEARHDDVYWIDLLRAEPPQRLARMPAHAVPTQRFFKPGAAHDQLLELLAVLERGGDVPPEIALGGTYQAKTLVPILRHLAAYLAPVPPQRRFDRHAVKHRMAVLNGLVNAFVAFSGEFGDRPAGLPVESWVVDNVSRGGVGARLQMVSGEWLRVGALVALQPEGGENWLLGIVRRYHRESESEIRVGIETLARQAEAAELKPRTASSYAALPGVPSLLLWEGSAPGEVRVVLPPATFDLRESMEASLDGKRVLLSPVGLVEQTADYELARYRVST